MSLTKKWRGCGARAAIELEKSLRNARARQPGPEPRKFTKVIVRVALGLSCFLVTAIVWNMSRQFIWKSYMGASGAVRDMLASPN